MFTRNPWMFIFFCGLSFALVFDVLLWQTLEQGWHGGYLVLAALGMLAAFGGLFWWRRSVYLPRIAASPAADLKGGMLLGGLLLLTGISGFATAEAYARTLPESTWIVYRIHPEIGVLMPYPNQARLDQASHVALPHYVATDSEGFRITDHTTLPDAERALNVLALGDSFTFGFAVDNDETYPYFLERALETQLGGRVDVTVLNGASIWQTIDGQNAVYDFINDSDLQPDVITLGYFGPNDLFELQQLPFIKQTLENEGVPRWAAASSALIRWRQARSFVYGVKIDSEGLRTHMQNADLDTLSAQYRSYFERLVNNIDAAGQQLYVLRIDGHDEPYGPDSTGQELIVELTQAYNIELVLLDYNPDDYLYPTDAHFSVEGNQHAARDLAQRIAAGWQRVEAKASTPN